MRDIKDIAKIIDENHGKLYLVGGAVRDQFLGIENHDEDYCVTGISVNKFKELFPDAITRGKAFAIFDIDKKEFALARKERKTGLGHKEFEIETDESITIKEDLARRDITINAIAKNVLTGEIIDPYGGVKDLKNGIIKAVTEHFKEDPLRAYRVARFASKFEFKVDKETIKMINSLKDELSTISVERVYAEFSKSLLTEKPSVFFDVLRQSEILDVHFEEIHKLIGAEQPPQYHPEGDAYNHTMIVLDKVAKDTKNYSEERKLEIRFAALVHDIGKGETPKEEYPHHYMHEARGKEIVKKMGHRLKLPTNLIKCGQTACLEHMKGGMFYNMKPGKQVEFIERVDKSLLKLDGLQIIVNADNNDAKDFATIGNKCLNEINGKYINKKSNTITGQNFGAKLHQERVEWIKHELT
ncbi:MAG: HD domain-containing protein [Clostridia bacterium]|nr:HD domain-containing protein [Clostridia bacterium]